MHVEKCAIYAIHQQALIQISNMNKAVWFRLDSDSDQTAQGRFTRTMSKAKKLSGHADALMQNTSCLTIRISLALNVNQATTQLTLKISLTLVLNTSHLIQQISISTDLSILSIRLWYWLARVHVLSLRDVNVKVLWHIFYFIYLFCIRPLILEVQEVFCKVFLFLV